MGIFSGLFGGSAVQEVDILPVSAEIAEEYIAMPKELRLAIAQLKGRAPVRDADVVEVPMSEAFPISAAIVLEERRQEAARQRAAREVLKNPIPGVLIPGEGIYLCQWQPKDRDGKSLGKIFNVFAAPEDLTDQNNKKVLLTFNNAAERVGALRDWHGFDGGHYENDIVLYKALKNGNAIGKWFIPTRDLLHGKDVDGKEVQKDNNLYSLQNEGKFKGTFTTQDSGSDYPDWYWSCTEHRETSSVVYDVRFSAGDADWHHKANLRLSCRPVRVVEVPRP